MAASPFRVYMVFGGSGAALQTLLLHHGARGGDAVKNYVQYNLFSVNSLGECQKGRGSSDITAKKGGSVNQRGKQVGENQAAVA